jgi:hypothetical protein
MRIRPTRRDALAVGSLAAVLLVISLVLTIAGGPSLQNNTRGQGWAIDRDALMKRPTLAEMNFQFGSDVKKITDERGLNYVWNHVALPGVVVIGRFADDGRLIYFKRVSNPKWRSDTGTYSLSDKTWEYSESK